jgi:hypothetical protein
VQGIVAFLVAKGANAAALRVPELVAKLRASELGEGFAVWVERNWASLITNERLKKGAVAEGRKPLGAGSGPTKPRGSQQPGASRGSEKSSNAGERQGQSKATTKPPDQGYSARGKTSGRSYHPEKAGGPIQSSDYRETEITPEGVVEVRTHTRRFEKFEPNDLMNDRLDKIAAGELEPTEYDQRYYTHELRELQRYRNLDIADNVDAGYDVWNDTHTATLEDYGLADKDPNGNPTLYHPDTWSLLK